MLYNLAADWIRKRPREISLTSAGTMSTLDRTGPMRLTELAANEGVTQPSMTSLVTALERDGLVERRQDPADKRVVLVALTDTGRERMRRRRQEGAEWFTSGLDKLSAADIASLVTAVPALNRLREVRA